MIFLFIFLKEIKISFFINYLNVSYGFSLQGSKMYHLNMIINDDVINHHQKPRRDYVVAFLKKSIKTKKTNTKNKK